MGNRYVKECINDWIKCCAKYGVEKEAREYGNRVKLEYAKGNITALEAVRMVVDVYPFELESGDYKNRFNKW